MPSTAWNVFVASGVAIVVYFATKMGQVLLGLAAGTILFLGGWLTGYAINEDLLDSMGLFRIGIAGVVSGFVVFWTVVVVEGEFLTGLLVMGLVWFAAWFTSAMGPIKGETGAMATIDEPRPPEGPRPGTPLDLGGEPSDDGTGNEGGGILGAVRGFAAPSAPDAPDWDESSSSNQEKPSPEELAAHGTPDDAETGAGDSTRKADVGTTGGGRESIFGLGIFYEGDPAGPTPAGADTDVEAPDCEAPDGDRSTTTVSHYSRPAVSGRHPGKADDAVSAETGSVDAEVTGALDSSGETERDGAQTPAAGEQPSRLREPIDSPRRPGTSPETETDPGYELYRGKANSEVTSEPEPGGPDADASAVDEGDPPAEHRVEVDDDGFIFG